jgi:hypothetical protein
MPASRSPWPAPAPVDWDDYIDLTDDGPYGEATFIEPALANTGEPAELIGRNVSAWFGHRKVLERCTLQMRPREVENRPIFAF